MRTLRPYQQKAVSHILHNRSAAVFADMGLGKTAATLHAILELPKPVLLIGPIRVIETVWRQEAKEWPETKDLRFSLVRGTPVARTSALHVPADVYLANPEILAEVLSHAARFKTLIIDESSMFKNPSTVRFKSLRKSLKFFDRKVILTGTPTPNSLMDLWSQIYILDEGQRLLPSFYAYRNRYFEQTDYQGFNFAPRPGAKDHITKQVADIVLRVEAKGNLPDREVLWNDVVVKLPKSAAKVYKDLEDKALFELQDDAISAATAAAALMKLRQVASGFVYTDSGSTEEVHTEKVKAVQEILDETQPPVVLVYQFKHELAALQKAFPQGKIFEPELMDDWNAGKVPLLFLHPASGGHGINLQKPCHTMIIYSASFSYEQMAQTVARIDRQGQEHPVVIHSIVADGTVDLLLKKILREKAETQSSVLTLIKNYAAQKTSHR